MMKGRGKIRTGAALGNKEKEDGRDYRHLSIREAKAKRKLRFLLNIAVSPPFHGIIRKFRKPSQLTAVVNEEGERLVDGKRYRFYVATFQPDERSRKLMGIDPIELDYTMDES